MNPILIETEDGRKIIAPNILLRGGPKALLSELEEKILPTLEATREALRSVQPHPRDYVTTELWSRANEEHWERINAFTRAIMDMQAIAGYLITGGAR